MAIQSSLTRRDFVKTTAAGVAGVAAGCSGEIAGHRADGGPADGGPADGGPADGGPADGGPSLDQGVADQGAPDQGLPSPTNHGVGANGITGTTSVDLYVDHETGNDRNAGTSIDSSKKTIQAAVDIAAAGTRVNVKAGPYGDQKIVSKASGTATNPIVIEGYTLTPGDSPADPDFDHTTALDPTKYPVLNHGNRLDATDHHGIVVLHDFVRVKGFQVTQFTYGARIAEVTGSELDNIYVTSVGDYNYHSGGPAGYRGTGIRTNGTYTTIRNSVVVNSCGEGISISGDYNTIEYSKVYADEGLEPLNPFTSPPTADQGCDYYFIVQGTHHWIHHCYEERVGDLGHGGHGFRVHGTDNLIEDCTGKHMKNSAFGVQYKPAQNNLFRRCTCIGSGVTGGPYPGNGSGIYVMRGASNNTFEDFTFIDCYTIVGYITGDDVGVSANNVFRRFHSSYTQSSKPAAVLSFVYRDAVVNNTWEDWTVVGAVRLFYIWGSGKMGTGNQLLNCSLTEIDNKLDGPADDYLIDSVAGSTINPPHSLP